MLALLEFKQLIVKLADVGGEERWQVTERFHKRVASAYRRTKKIKKIL